MVVNIGNLLVGLPGLPVLASCSLLAVFFVVTSPLPPLPKFSTATIQRAHRLQQPEVIPLHINFLNLFSGSIIAPYPPASHRYPCSSTALSGGPLDGMPPVPL